MFPQVGGALISGGGGCSGRCVHLEELQRNMSQRFQDILLLEIPDLVINQFVCVCSKETGEAGEELFNSKANNPLSLTTDATQHAFPQTPIQSLQQTSIVSRHLATRGNMKILRTPAPHGSCSEEILPASLVAPLPHSEKINHPSSDHINTKSTPIHILHHYALSVTLTHTTNIIFSTVPTYATHCHPWICGQTPPE